MDDHQKAPCSPDPSSAGESDDDSSPVSFPVALDDPVGDKVEKRLREIRKEIDEMTAAANARANRPPANGGAPQDLVYTLPTQVDPADSQSQAYVEKIKDILDGNEDEVTYDAHSDLLGDTDTCVSSQEPGLDTAQQRPPNAGNPADSTPTANQTHPVAKVVTNEREDNHPDRYVEIDGLPIKIKTLKNGLDVTEAYDPILPYEDLADPLFVAMSKTSYKDLKLRERIDMLYALVENGKDLSFWFHDDLKILDTMQALDEILKETYSSRYQLKQYPLALKLYQAYKLMMASDRKRDARGLCAPTKEPFEIAKFRAWVNRLKKKSVGEAVKNSGSKKGRSKKNQILKFNQPGGGTTYFPIAMEVMSSDPRWMHKREKETCPACGHAMVMVVNDAESIRKQNEYKKKDYELAVLDWENSGGQKNKRPKVPKGNIEQMLVCMCCVSQCVDPYSGKGCIVCEEYIQNSPDGRVPWDQQWARCICSICTCKCSVYFPRSKWQFVALFGAEQKALAEKKALEKTLSTKKKQTSEYSFIFVLCVTTILIHSSPC